MLVLGYRRSIPTERDFMQLFHGLRSNRDVSLQLSADRVLVLPTIMCFGPRWIYWTKNRAGMQLLRGMASYGASALRSWVSVSGNRHIVRQSVFPRNRMNLYYKMAVSFENFQILTSRGKLLPGCLWWRIRVAVFHYIEYSLTPGIPYSLPTTIGSTSIPWLSKQENFLV